jgi:CPA1 family monovalent cation:H+ antiporter
MHDIVLTIFALTGLLGLVSLLLPLADRLAVPYAVLLAAVGCAIGALTALASSFVGVGIVGDMVHALDGFDLTAEALLYIFLPALLFETALNVDVQRLTEEIAPVLLLAVIGVLVSWSAWRSGRPSAWRSLPVSCWAPSWRRPIRSRSSPSSAISAHRAG